LVGDDVTGQGMRIWLRLGPIAIQPAEVLRVALVVFLAAYLSEHQVALSGAWRRFGPLSLPDPWRLLPVLGAVGTSMLTVVAQRDFGPALIFGATFLAMLYLALGRRDLVVALGGFFLAGGIGALLVSARLQERIA